MKLRSTLLPLGLGVLLLPACGTGGASEETAGFGILEASNGFGRLLPYTIPRADAQGLPTAEVVEIQSVDDLLDNLTLSNPINPPTEWPSTAVLPSNAPGNHFVYVRFTEELDPESLLAATSGSVNNLAGNIQVVRVDPLTGVTTEIPGRGFVGGRTFNLTTGVLESWLERDGDGNLVTDVNGNLVPATLGGGQPGLGLPGTQGRFAGDALLYRPDTFLFVANASPTDSLDAPYETFLTGVQIQVRINEGVTSMNGDTLQETGLASSTVGPDTVPPEVLVSGSGQTPVILPANGEIDVDPETNIEVTFTEPIQLLTLGSLDDGSPPAVTAAIQIQFGPSPGTVDVPFHIRPFSVLDLSRIELVPLFDFPGSVPGVDCGSFADVQVRVNPAQFDDLSGNVNTLSPTSSFRTANGPGLVNAPVMPDVIYIGRTGANPGISVIDLNGFGASTGNPTYDVANPIVQGNSNFPNNPNVALQGAALIPPLTPGTCTFDGGSAGAFTLTRDTTLNDLLAGSPILESIEDMAVGHALDLTFNAAAPFGCQAGGGNICATTGLKFLQVTFGSANTVAPATSSTFPVQTIFGSENPFSFAPHPNPPPIVFPPPCTSPFIASEEPTSTNVLAPNLLVPGSNRFGDPAINQPPQNLLSTAQNAFFGGPTPSQTNAQLCLTYQFRQQVGHFLYVVDRAAREVVVLNSNRFTVIDRIRLSDPTSLAMAPNLDLLAVTNQGSDSVSFINIDPTSARFHDIVRTTRVGVGPTGIAWDSGNEDILVCNQSEGTVSVISAFTLNVRKVIRNQLTSPIDVAMTPRQLGFGFQRGVYFAYILNANGRLAIFESGPDGVNGFGFDDVITTLPFTFRQPKAIQPDVTVPNSAVWIVHEGPLDLEGDPTGQPGGAVSTVGITSGLMGIVPLDLGAFSDPSLRDLEFGVMASIGEGDRGLSGVPVDIAFDNQVNVAVLTNFSSQFSSGAPLPVNGKSIVKANGGNALGTASPQFMFLPVPRERVVDVIELETGTLQRFDVNVFEPGVQSIPVNNASIVVDYLRQ